VPLLLCVRITPPDRKPKCTVPACAADRWLRRGVTYGKLPLLAAIAHKVARLWCGVLRLVLHVPMVTVRGAAGGGGSDGGGGGDCGGGGGASRWGEVLPLLSCCVNCVMDVCPTTVCPATLRIPLWLPNSNFEEQPNDRAYC
jgi:hypothetical protein